MPKTTLDFGFVQVPVELHQASENDELDLKTLCHGKPPKMSIKCQEGNEEYTSWNKVPERGYEWAKGQYVIVTPAELEEVKAKRPTVDSMKVEKAVDFAQAGVEYAARAEYRVLPPRDANETTRASYRAIYETVKESGQALLVRYAPTTKVRHYAVVADPEGVLMAYELKPKRALPFPVPAVAADPKVKKQAQGLLASVASDDVHMEPEPDPLFDLVQAKIAHEVELPGIGQTVMDPK